MVDQGDGLRWFKKEAMFGEFGGVENGGRWGGGSAQSFGSCYIIISI